MAAPAAALENVSRYVFVPARASTSVAVIDTSTDAVAATIRIGGVPKQIAISKTLNYLVATHDGLLSVVDLASELTIAKIPLPVTADRLLINPGGDLIAIADVASGAVSTISLRELRETGRVSGLRQPNSMFFSRDGKRLYVGNLGADYVSIIDVAEHRVVGTIPVTDPTTQSAAAHRGVISVASTPYAWAGFAAYGDGDKLAVIDLRSDRMIKTLELKGSVERAYGTGDGAFMIVPNSDRTISLISLATLSEVARLPGAADITDVRTAYLETLAFAMSRGEDKVIVIDLADRKTIGEIRLPAPPETGVTSPAGAKLYVAIGRTNQVAVIDVIHHELVKLIDNVGREPWGAFTAGSLAYCH